MPDAHLGPKEVHADFVKATDFLSTIFRAYEDLINVDCVNRLEHMKNCDNGLGKVRKCFKKIEMHTVSDKYFRSVLGFVPAPYLECELIQNALEQNSPEYLTALVKLEVSSIERILEQPEMYSINAILTPSMLSVPQPVTTRQVNFRIPTHWRNPTSHSSLTVNTGVSYASYEPFGIPKHTGTTCS